MTRLTDLPAVSRAEVYKGQRHAGVLERLSDGIRFSYRPDYLSEGGPAVATTLPLSDEPVVTPGGAVPPYFAGLLPEGRRLGAIRRAVKTSSDDDLSLLLAVGADVVGDATVHREGEGPEQVQPAIEIDDLGKVRFADVFRRAIGDHPDRVGIAGVQDKVSAAMITLPVRQVAGQYILKLNPPEYSHLVENEAFFLAAARKSGLQVAESTLVRDADGNMGLLVRRFDRVISAAGGQTALAVEDACQVLGRYPAAKYTVTSEQVALALRDVTPARLVAARDLLRQFAFAYLTCNGDAHAKNFSILKTLDGEWRVSPAYDLPSSHPYGDHTLALSIGGRRRENVTRRNFIEFGSGLGVGERVVTRLLDELCDSVDLWIDEIEQLPFGTQRNRKLKRAIEYRRKQLRPHATPDA